jgi:hypothetical protein
MRAVTIASVLSLAVAASSQAALIASNLPATNSSGLAYGLTSDAISSNGTYFYKQAAAISIMVGQPWSLGQLTFWGSSEAFNSPDLSNFAGFQATIYNSTFTQVVAQRTWTMAQLATIATGNTNTAGGVEYQFAGSLGGITLASSGVYRISIGALLADPEGDAFVWTAGQTAGGGFTTGSTGTWGSTWTANSPIQGTGSFMLFGNVVPAPGALAFLAIGATRSRRRRA